VVRVLHSVNAAVPFRNIRGDRQRCAGKLVSHGEATRANEFVDQPVNDDRQIDGALPNVQISVATERHRGSPLVELGPAMDTVSGSERLSGITPTPEELHHR
jgi:predicted xylose isomerase-like sugar epimerase